MNYISFLQFIVPEGFCVTTLALEHQLQHPELKRLIADIVDISCGKKKEDLKDYCDKYISRLTACCTVEIYFN